MLPNFQQNISKIDDKDETNSPTIESVMEWLSDSSVHPRNKVNSFQWFHIPTLLTTHIQSQQEQPTKQNNEVLSQLLQRMMTILDECFDCHTPIANKRLLHSSLSQLSQSPSLDPKIKRKTNLCLTALESIEEGRFVLVEIDTLASIDRLRKDHDELQAILSESERKNTQLEKEATDLHDEKTKHLSMIQSLQFEKEQIQRENERLRGESEKRVVEMQKTMDVVRDQLDSHIGQSGAKECIVAFSPEHITVNGSTVTNISWGGASCFTKPVSKGIHRLSINTDATYLMIGVCDAAEYPEYLTMGVSKSPKAGMMHQSGFLWSADKQLVPNTKVEKGQEWSAEADLERRTLHFFIDGVQQKHHFKTIPIPLVFAIDVGTKDVPIGITFWGELKKSSVTFKGTGRKLG
ncbi:hypothetical protein BLNAU_16483 [Blattamonas nauphoetae]|uniref:SPRY domain-containing protein n=1 Tax=Blattamonas nauphoetae TaxID=2049346 RepID=A0ABQ9XB19_9EUKA|nr:hypothetical protein BLNAU_16483 [Blattamonas nauphoetae]